MPCFSEGKTCSDSLICDSCIDSNAEPQSTFGCICKVGYFNRFILTTESTFKAESYSDPYSFMNKNNGCEYNESFYEDESGTCLSCFKDCKSGNFLNCIACKDSSAEINEPRCACKSGYYNSSNADELTCNVCTSCDLKYELVER